MKDRYIVNLPGFSKLNLSAVKLQMAERTCIHDAVNACFFHPFKLIFGHAKRVFNHCRPHSSPSSTAACLTFVMNARCSCSLNEFIKKNRAFRFSKLPFFRGFEEVAAVVHRSSYLKRFLNEPAQFLRTNIFVEELYYMPHLNSPAIFLIYFS